MSVDAAAWSPVSALPPLEPPAEALTGQPGGQNALESGLGANLAGALAPDAALPAFGLEGATLAGDTAAAAQADQAPWGSPADELAAGGQLRGLTEMARELARGSHALRSAEDSAAASLRAGAAPGEAPAALATAAGAASAAELVPAVPLVPGLVPSLQAGAGERPAPSTDLPRRDDERRVLRERHGHGAGLAQADDEDGEAGGDAGQAHDQAPEALPAQPHEAPADAAWCASLLAALQRAAMAEPAARDALKAAADAWGRGRAVLLACPDGVADAQAAWLFVLRPVPGPGALRLGGERFPARLRWARIGAGVAGRWWAVRVAKTYSLRRGGQMVTQEVAADGRVSCELQLGPFPPALPRWREVLVRVDRVQRLWQALGTQWSLPLLVCDQALLAPDAPGQGGPGMPATQGATT